MAVKMLVLVFRIVTQCSLVDVYKVSEGPIVSIVRVDGSDILMTTYKTTWCHNPEDHNQHFQFHSAPTHSFRCDCDLRFQLWLYVRFPPVSKDVLAILILRVCSEVKRGDFPSAPSTMTEERGDLKREAQLFCNVTPQGTGALSDKEDPCHII
jgi:hypothetical protein